MRAADGIRGITILAFIIILVLAILEFSGEGPFIEGVTFGSIQVIVAVVVVFILVNVAADQTIKEQRKKYGTLGALHCPACLEVAKKEADAAHQVELAEVEKWKAELNAMAEKDIAVRTVVQEWKATNGDIVPGRATIAELVGALNFEKAGNFENAAKIYEQHKLWSLAGKVREKSRVQTVKHVTVDMNQLIEQIGTRGLAIPYRCHTCGASITIDKNSSVSGLKFCSYCGSAYNIEDMTKIVQEALS